MNSGSVEVSPGANADCGLLLAACSATPLDKGLEASLVSRGAEGVAFDTLQERLSADPSSRALVVYSNPVLEVAAALQRAPGGAKHLEAWTRRATSIVALLRANRRRLTLVDAEAAVNQPERFRSLLQSRTGFEARAHDSAAAAGRKQPSPLLLAVADVIVRGDPETGALWAEIAACSLPLKSPVDLAPSPLLERVEAFRAWEAETAAGATEGSGNLQEENELLLLQLERMRQELKTYITANREMEAVLLEASARPTPEQQAKLESRLARAERDLEAVHKALSWRWTAPARRLLGPFMGRGKR